MKTPNPKNKKKSDKHFSFIFLATIPGNFLLAVIALLALISVHNYIPFNTERWSTAAVGFIGALAVVGTSKMSRLRVLVHEIKHAVVVVLTGNNLKNIVVKSETGHVEYQMYRDRLHLAPLILLAPYFFPLFSLPVLITCIFLEQTNPALLALALGAAFSADLSFSITDLHPHQSDLQRISGGPLVALTYLASIHTLWAMLCALWIAAGRKGYVYAVLATMDMLSTKLGV